MNLQADARSIVRARLVGRIDTLRHTHPGLSRRRLAFAVDDIRREAGSVQMDAVVSLASGLQRATATPAGNAPLMPYLDAMLDALDGYSGCDRLSRDAEAALLATVGLRLHA